MGIIKKACIASLTALMLLASLCVFSSAPVMADDSLSSTTVINTSAWPVSEAQAVEIASSYLPSDAVAQAKVSVTVINGTEPGNGVVHIWNVSFSEVSIKRDELSWRQNTDTSVSSEDVYYECVQIGVNAVTGEVVLKIAWPQGMPRSIPIATKVIEAPFFSSPYWRILGGVGLYFAVVIGYLAVRMWFMNRAER